MSLRSPGETRLKVENVVVSKDKEHLCVLEIIMMMMMMIIIEIIIRRTRTRKTRKELNTGKSYENLMRV